MSEIRKRIESNGKRFVVCFRLTSSCLLIRSKLSRAFLISERFVDEANELTLLFGRSPVDETFGGKSLPAVVGFAFVEPSKVN